MAIGADGGAACDDFKDGVPPQLHSAAALNVAAAETIFRLSSIDGVPI